MWFCRRMLKISHVDCVTNIEVLRRVQMKGWYCNTIETYVPTKISWDIIFAKDSLKTCALTAGSKINVRQVVREKRSSRIPLPGSLMSVSYWALREIGWSGECLFMMVRLSPIREETNNDDKPSLCARLWCGILKMNVTRHYGKNPSCHNGPSLSKRL